MNAKKGNVIFTVLCVSISIIIIIWIVFSYCNPRAYFSAPFHSIITITLGILVSYYLVQRNTDERRKRDLVEQMLEQIRKKVSELQTTLHTDDLGIEKLLMARRAIKNKLDKCNKIKMHACFRDELSVCFSYLDSLGEIIEDCVVHKNELGEYLIVKRNELIKTFENIENACDNVVISLWTK